jgi:hypothetical protein
MGRKVANPLSGCGISPCRMKSGVAKKNIFSGSEKMCFFSHMLALLPVHSKSIFVNLKH